MKTLIKTITILAVLTSSTSAMGMLYRLDFGGQTSNGSFEGYFILDYSVPDLDPDPNRGQFRNIIVGLDITVLGVRYTVESGLPIIAVTIDQSSIFGDLFGIGGNITNDEGDTSFVAIQVQDLSNMAFSSAALPTSLDLTDFDPHNPSDTNSTGAIINPPGFDFEFVPLDFIELRPVPLPAAGWLFLGALTAFAGRRRQGPAKG